MPTGTATATFTSGTSSGVGTPWSNTANHVGAAADGVWSSTILDATVMDDATSQLRARTPSYIGLPSPEPPGFTVNGIEVSYTVRQDLTDSFDYSFRLRYGASSLGNIDQINSTTTGTQTLSFYGPNDTGGATLTYADITDSVNFGGNLSGITYFPGSGLLTVEVDFVQFVVHFSYNDTSVNRKRKLARRLGMSKTRMG